MSLTKDQMKEFKALISQGVDLAKERPDDVLVILRELSLLEDSLATGDGNAAPKTKGEGN